MKIVYGWYDVAHAGSDDPCWMLQPQRCRNFTHVTRGHRRRWGNREVQWLLFGGDEADLHDKFDTEVLCP